VLRWFGKYSYAIYVFQAPLAAAFKALMQRKAPGVPEFAGALIVFACTTAVSCGGGTSELEPARIPLSAPQAVLREPPIAGERTVATLHQAATV